MSDINWSDWEAVGTTSPEENTFNPNDWETVNTPGDVNTQQGTIPLNIRPPREGENPTPEQVLTENVGAGIRGKSFPILEGLSILDNAKQPLPAPSPDMYEGLDLQQSQQVFDFYMSRRDQGEDAKSLDFRPTYQGAVIPTPPTTDVPYFPDRSIMRGASGIVQGAIDGAYEMAETGTALIESYGENNPGSLPGMMVNAGKAFTEMVDPDNPVVTQGAAQTIAQESGRVNTKKFIDDFMNEAGRQIPSLLAAGYTPVSLAGKFAIEQVGTAAATDEAQGLGLVSPMLIQKAPELTGDILEGDEFARRKSLEKFGLLVELTAISGGLIGAGQAAKFAGRFAKRGIADPIAAQFGKESGRRYIDGELLANLAEPLEGLSDEQSVQAINIIRSSLKNAPEDTDTLRAVVQGIDQAINNNEVDDVLKERLFEVSQRALKVRKSTAITRLPDVDRLERERLQEPIKQTQEAAQQFSQESAEQVPDIARRSAEELRGTVDELQESQTRQLDIESRRGLRNVEQVGNIGSKIKEAREGGSVRNQLNRDYTNLIDRVDDIEEGVRFEVDTRYDRVKQAVGNQPVDPDLIDEVSQVTKKNLDENTTYGDLLDSIDSLNRAYDKAAPEVKPQILALKDRILFTELDDIIESGDAPEEVVGLLNDARTYYRDEYADKFINTENVRPTGLAAAKATKGSGRTTEAGRASRLKELRSVFTEDFAPNTSPEAVDNLVSILEKRGNAEDRSRIGRIIAGESALRIRRIMDTSSEFNLENDAAVSQVIDTLTDYQSKVTGKEQKKIKGLIQTLKTKSTDMKAKREALDELIKERHREVKAYTSRVVRPFLNEMLGTNIDEMAEGPLSKALQPSANALDTQMDQFFNNSGPNKIKALVKRVDESLSPEDQKIVREGLKRATFDKLDRMMNAGADTTSLQKFTENKAKAFALLDSLDLDDKEKVLVQNLKGLFEEVSDFSARSEKAGGSITPSGLSGAMGSEIPDETKGALNKVISIVWGVLNPTATKLRQGAGVLTGNYGNREDFFKSYINQILSDPDFYADRLSQLEGRNASREVISKAISDMTYRVLQTSARSRSDFESFDQELDRAVEEYEMDSINTNFR